MPEPTASTALPKVPNRYVAALALVVFAASASPVLAQNSEIAKAREEAQKLEKPLQSDFDEAKKAFRSVKQGFTTALFSGAKNKREEQKLDAGLEYNLFLLTNPKLELHELQDLREDFVRLMSQAGVGMNAGIQRRKHQEKVFRKVIELTDQLLDGNFFVRAQAITILGSMNYSTRPVEVPYTGSQAALLRVAKTSIFPEHRLLAMAGLNRMLRFGKLTGPEQSGISELMAKELMKPGLSSGIYYRLAHWLQFAEQTFELRAPNRPVSVIALIESMCDAKRSWIARCAAARALGYATSGDASINWKSIAWKVAEFTHDAAAEFKAQQDAGGRPADPVDKEAIYDVVLSFAPGDKENVAAGKGLISRSNGTAKPAFTKALPLFSAILGGKDVDKKSLKALEDWVTANKPADLKYHVKAPPLPVKKPADEGTPPGNQQTGSGQGSNGPPAQPGQ